MTEIERLMKNAKEAYEAGISIEQVAKKAGRDMTDAEKEEALAKFEIYDDFKRKADSLKRSEELKAEADAYFNQPATIVPLHDESEAKANDHYPRGMTKEEAIDVERKVFTDFLRGIKVDGQRRPCLIDQEVFKRYNAFERKTMSRLTDADGGFFVQTEMVQDIIQQLKNRVYIRQRARTMTTGESSVKIPVADYAWTMDSVQDNGAVSVQGVTDIAGMKTFTIYDFSRIVKVPESLLDDAFFDLAGWLINDFIEVSARLDESLFIQGTGVNQPTGLLNSGITTVDIDTATSGNIVANDLQDLPYELKAQYRENAVWLMPRSIVQQARKLRTEDGGSGLGNFVWQPGLQAGQPSTLAGYPLLETEYFPTISADGDAVAFFGDLNQYMIVDRAMAGVRVLNELYAANRQVGYRFDKRLDAQYLDINAARVLVRT